MSDPKHAGWKAIKPSELFEGPRSSLRKTFNGTIKRSTKPISKTAKTKGPKTKAWAAFSKYIRLRDSLKYNHSKDIGICYTCKKEYPNWGKGCLQAGHFVQGRANSYLFDERGVHAQCYNCNINLKGCWPKYLMYMRMDYGEDVVAELIDMYTNHKAVSVKAYEYVALEHKYQDALDKLQVDYLTRLAAT